MYRQIKAEIENILSSSWKPIILILGPRQTGKTTLAESIVDKNRLIRFNFDLVEDIQQFKSLDRTSLDLFAKNNHGKYVIIDEVQKYPPATGVVKFLYDSYKQSDLKFILTGSSEIKIRRGAGDTLTGRVYEAKLYPLSLSEINIQSGFTFESENEYSNFQENQNQLQKYLIYGSLPSLQNIPLPEYMNFIRGYVNNLFSKDLLEIGNIRKSTQALLLAKLLAQQIGQLVNFNELAVNTELNRETVVRIINIFEQIGLITIASPISTNERESISKAAKIYFIDLGVRNFLVNNFENCNLRQDKGQLLENAVFVGMKRQLDYKRDFYRLGFFRSPYGKEIDIVKKTDKAEELYEVKFSGKPRRMSPNVTLINFDTAQKYLY